jgi:MFS family permease
MRTRFLSLLSPLHHRAFRRLWLSMSLSFAGDCLQNIAQAWLVATVTGSALAVGGIGMIAAIPQLFILVGGAVGDRLDRRRLLVTTQLVGAGLAAIVVLLVVTGRIVTWHIYLWALAAGLIWLFTRPAYKVILTESVPANEVRPAAGLNSITESTLRLMVNALGSLLLALVGLPIAFFLNALSYLAAGLSLRGMPSISREQFRVGANPSGLRSDETERDAVVRPEGFRASSRRFTLSEIASDLLGGLRYLIHQPRIFHPLLLTYLIVACLSPASGLLAAIVHKQGGSIVGLGLLAAGSSLGGIVGATYAGMRADARDPVRQYGLFALAGAGALAVFALIPASYVSLAPLALFGFMAVYQAVSNTSRIRLLADPVYQARLQSIATMVFWIGNAAGQLWGGIAVDRFGVTGLLTGSVILLAVGGWALLTGFRQKHPAIPVSVGPEPPRTP